MGVHRTRRVRGMYPRAGGGFRELVRIRSLSLINITGRPEENKLIIQFVVLCVTNSTIWVLALFASMACRFFKSSKYKARWNVNGKLMNIKCTEKISVHMQHFYPCLYPCGLLIKIAPFACLYAWNSWTSKQIFLKFASDELRFVGIF
jgi:hypothetical protein